jgi:hypothetical protein
MPSAPREKSFIVLTTWKYLLELSPALLKDLILNQHPPDSPSKASSTSTYRMPADVHSVHLLNDLTKYFNPVNKYSLSLYRAEQDTTPH